MKEYIKSFNSVLVMDEKLITDNNSYLLSEIDEIILHATNFAMLEDNLLLSIVFADNVVTVPSGHRDFEALLQQLFAKVKLDNEKYLQAMSGEIECDFTLYRK